MVKAEMGNENSGNTMRCLNLSSLPGGGYPIVTAMLDLTLQCNLRCRYCFKEKRDASMTLRLAQDAVVWLIYASDTAKEINICFMGGEPLLQEDLIKQLIPFGTQRAKDHGKKIRFSVTTNATLVSQDIVDFAKQNSLHFHLSLDGVPEVQDFNRPLTSGGASSPLIEKSVKLVLKENPLVMARACLAAENAGRLLESFRYFRNLGFVSIGFFPCEMDGWSDDSLEIYEQQFGLLGEEYIQNCRNASAVNLQPLELWFSKKQRETRGTSPCGSGRGLVLIDTQGGIFPCSRFSSYDSEKWQLGNIYEGWFADTKRRYFADRCIEDEMLPECVDCIARKICEGGCLAENLETTGHTFRMHPNDCKIYRIHARVGTKVHDILYGEKNPLFMKKYYPQEWKELEAKNNNDIPNEPCPA